MDQTINFSVTGDSLIVKRLCSTASSFLELRNLFSASDVCFTNLETSVHKFEQDVYPSRFSGGDWVATSPDVLYDLKLLGFNFLGIPNNHSMDWLHNGLIHTIENLEKAHVTFAGVGRNLAEACAPAYLETPNGRVALIACNSSFEPWHMAGEQRRDIQGRPGIFGIEFEQIQYISQEELSVLESLHNKTLYENDGWINSNEDRLFRFGNHLYKVGKGDNFTRVCNSSLKLLKNSIQEAKRMADLVVVSCHSHERQALDPHIPAAFQKELAYFSIDQGANIFVAHGPHVIRGIEIYHGCPVFHGLGNFFYQCELLPKAPSEFYSKFSSFDEKACTADVYDYRVNNGGILGETNPNYFRSMLASFTMHNGTLDKLTIYPVSLQFSSHRASKGTPVLASENDADIILSQIQKLSDDFHTSFERIGNTLELKI